MRVGFVGAGGISRAHAGALRQIEGVELAGYFDVNVDAARARADEYGGVVCEDVRQLFDLVDAVYVLTPPRSHRETVLAAAERGKAIFCEKPIAVSLAAARDMIAATAGHGVPFAMGFNHRFRPQLQRVRAVLSSGGIGEVLSCWSRRLGYNRPRPETNWRTSRAQLCGMTIESVSHDIDMLRYLLGEIAEVSAVITSSVPELSDYDDNLAATLTFESGAIGSIHASWSSHLTDSSRGVVGSTGTVCVDGPDLWTMSRVRSRLVADAVESVEVYPDRVAADWGYLAANQSFVRAVAEDREPEATGTDGLRALEVSTALLESVRSRTSVAVARSA